MKNRFLVFSFGLLFLAAHDCWAMGRTPIKEAPSSPSPVQPIQKLDLETSYRLAVQRSETIAIHQEEISKAYANWMQSVGDSVGDVNFVITDNFQDARKGSSDSSSSGSTFTGYERRERKFVITQPLFRGFKSLGAVLGAGNLKNQRVQEQVRAEQVLFLEVVNAYFTVLAQKKDGAIIEDIHKLFNRRVHDLSEREKIGRSRSSEVITAQSRLKIIQAQLAQSKGALKIAEDILEFYIGIPAGSFDLEDMKISKEKEKLPEDLFAVAENRPDVIAAKRAALQARNALIVTQGDLWPEISLESNHYELREGSQSGVDWDLLFKIDIPIATGGTTLGKIKEDYHGWKQADLNYSLVSRQAELEIKQTHQSWITSKEQSDALAEAVQASQENYRMQEEDYLHNLVNNLDVLEALESLFTTRRDANQAHYEMKINYWRYQVALGKGIEHGA